MIFVEPAKNGKYKILFQANPDVNAVELCTLTKDQMQKLYKECNRLCLW